MIDQYDVIVVGGGGSGLAAAVSAAEHGASVLLLEKQRALGGTTGIAIGSLTACRTSLQQAAGIDDDSDAHAEDVAKFAPQEIEDRGDHELRRFFLSQSAETLRWLTAMGLVFHGPSPEPPNRVPRMHNVVPNAKAYIATLQSQLLRRGGTIICDADVHELLRNGERVVGVTVRIGDGRKKFHTRGGVVLAAGDYSSAPSTISRFKGDQFANIEGINPNSLGDGHRLAESVGAKLLNMDVTYGPELRFVPAPGKTFEQLLPSQGIFAGFIGKLLPLVPRAVINWRIKRLLVTWQHPESSLFDAGAILVNRNGHRFCNEGNSPQREIAISNQPDKICYILLDQRLIERYSRWPYYISTAPQIAYAYANDYLKLRPDVAVQAASLESLSGLRQISASQLVDTVRKYNKTVEGQDDRFGCCAEAQRMEGNRWMLLGPAKAYFTTTEGGVAISRRMEAIDKQGQIIPGLYAVGSSGMGGQILWGHGLHIAWAITSGRLVGKQLAQSVQA